LLYVLVVIEHQTRRIVRCNVTIHPNSRTHASLDGNTPAEISGDRVAQPALLNSCAWEKHCGGLFQLRLQLELQFAMHNF